MRPQSILVIDHQAYWRSLAEETLHSAGYVVATTAIYDEALQQDFALILLGCNGVQVEECSLIARLLSRKQHIVVLATSLSAHTMRTLFIRGVEDVGDKTYDPLDLVKIVALALERVAASQHPDYTPERRISHE